MPDRRQIRAWLDRAEAELDAWAASSGVTQGDYEGVMRCMGLALEDQMALAGWKPALALTACLKAARAVRDAFLKARTQAGYVQRKQDWEQRLDRLRRDAVERDGSTKKTDRQGD